MISIFLQTAPFFLIVAIGYFSGKYKFLGKRGTDAITKFVFYFALSAMLFRFSSQLEISEIFDLKFVGCYVVATSILYLVVIVVSYFSGTKFETAVFDAQIATVGNTGFLGIPLLATLVGSQSVGYVMMILATDFAIFGTLIVVLIMVSRDQSWGIRLLRPIAKGLFQNPMIVSFSLGIFWGYSDYQTPKFFSEFLVILGQAATPGALFAIGASLSFRKIDDPKSAFWLSFLKLVAHPFLVGIMALYLFYIEPYAAAVMVITAALPVAGNTFMLAQHYKIDPERISAAILLSTLFSALTVTYAISFMI
ncbi:AEC family transporter [Paracoccaceae bacterium]|nr:AEC family transporter [Paracoccaceae bacterium]MDC3205332.1 AEC family transporter [Paracoccaceae bacterium]